MLNISYAGCLGLSSATSAQFILQLYATAYNCKKNNKIPILRFKVFKVAYFDNNAKDV